MKILQETIGATPTLRVSADSWENTPTSHSRQGQSLRRPFEETSCWQARVLRRGVGTPLPHDSSSQNVTREEKGHLNAFGVNALQSVRGHLAPLLPSPLRGESVTCRVTCQPETVLIMNADRIPFLVTVNEHWQAVTSHLSYSNTFIITIQPLLN